MFGGKIEQLDHIEEDFFCCVQCRSILFCLELNITGNYGQMAFIKVIKAGLCTQLGRA